jgi:predicted amidohydrolase YtcJ
MKSPYADGKNCNPIWSRSDLEPVVVASDKAGLQVAIHAIGTSPRSMLIIALSLRTPEQPPSPR